MAIEFTCACGKVLKAKNEAAGKRAKCMHCGQPVLVPNASERAPATPAVASGLSTPPAAVPVVSAVIPPPAEPPMPIPAVADVGTQPNPRWQAIRTIVSRGFGEVLQYTRELPAYAHASQDFWAGLREADAETARTELRFYVSPGSDNGEPVIADFGPHCIACGERVPSPANNATYTVRDSGYLLLQALLAFTVALVFWLALRELLAPRLNVAATWWGAFIKYSLPMSVFLTLLLEGLHHHRPRAVQALACRCSRHGSTNPPCHATLRCGELTVLGHADEVPRGPSTLLAMRQNSSFDHASLPNAWEVFQRHLLLIGLIVTGVLWLALLVFAPRGVPSWTWLVSFWTVALWCVLGGVVWLEKHLREQAIERIHNATKRARSSLLDCGFPLDPQQLDSIRPSLETEDCEALETLVKQAVHPAEHQAALAAYADLLFAIVADHSGTETAFQDPLPATSLPRLEFLAQELPKMAESPHPPARFGAVMILHRLGPLLPTASSLLATLLDDDDEHTRSRAAKELAHLGATSREHLPRLLSMAASGGDGARSTLTLRELQRIEPDTSQLVSRLIDELNAPALARRRRSAKYLSELGSTAFPAIRQLAHAMIDDDPQVRRELSAALQTIVAKSSAGESTQAEVVPTLLAVLDDSHPVRRTCAANLLGGLGTTANAAADALARRAADGYPHVRAAARKALTCIDTSRHEAFLVGLPARIVASDQRVLRLRNAIKDFRTPDQLAEIRERMEKREQKIRELGKGFGIKPTSQVGGALAFGAAALAVGLNPAQALITGGLHQWSGNKLQAKEEAERKEGLKKEIVELEDRQREDRQEIDRALNLTSQGLPIDSPALIRRIVPLLDAETSAEVLALGQEPEVAARCTAALLLGEEIAPLEDRVPLLCTMLRTDPAVLVRQRAAASLGLIAGDAPDARECLLEALEHDADELVRAAAAEALKSCEA